MGETIAYFAFIAALIVGFVLIVLGVNETTEITDQRGCKVIEVVDNQVFGADSRSVTTYCPED